MDLIWLIKFLVLTLYPFYLTVRKVVLYIVAPALVHMNPSMMSRVVCQNRPMPWALPWPFPTELDQPQKLGLENSKQFRVKTQGESGGGGEVAAWHVPPLGEPEGCKFGSKGKPVIIYCHGNTETRAKFHRILMYQKLTQLGYHVVTFDYRGFADSTDLRPTEETMVEDAVSIYDHVDKNCAKDVAIFIWGHSLGTGVACALTVALESTKSRMPRGVILESPFYNIADLLKNHPDFAPWSGMIFYERHFLDALHEAGFEFRSCDHVTRMQAAILILHADDDPTIRFEIGFRLYQNSKLRTNKMTREFYGFVGNRGFGHNRIVDAAEFPEVLDCFIIKALMEERRGTMTSDTVFLSNNENAIRLDNKSQNHKDSTQSSGFLNDLQGGSFMPRLEQDMRKTEPKEKQMSSTSLAAPLELTQAADELLSKKLDELEELVQSETNFDWNSRE